MCTNLPGIYAVSYLTQMFGYICAYAHISVAPIFSSLSLMQYYACTHTDSFSTGQLPPIAEGEGEEQQAGTYIYYSGHN